MPNRTEEDLPARRPPPPVVFNWTARVLGWVILLLVFALLLAPLVWAARHAWEWALG